MPVIQSKLNTNSDEFKTNSESMNVLLAELDELLAETRAGGGEKYVQRHRDRGKLMARERIELLLDPDSPFLELQPFVGYGTDYKVGGSLVAGIGVIEGVECTVTANDPTVRGGASNPHTWRKAIRMHEISHANRLPGVALTESGGADLPSQAELFVPGGQLFRDITRGSAMRGPSVSLVFGNSTAGGAYVPGMCDYTVFVKERAKVFLGGPPLVKMATGEDSTDEELGGAEMHARISGLADYMADDELDAIRLGRQIFRNLNWHKLGPGQTETPQEPLYDPEELIGIPSADLKVPFDVNEVLARVVDGSRYDEFKPLYGSALSTGWASIHGFPVGILVNTRGILFSEEAKKATQFIQLANQRDVPLIFMHNATGFMVGKEYEQGGIIKDGAMMINAVSNSKVPHFGLIIGASYGAANYAMSGRAYAPRFLFSWPNAKCAVMGPQQLAGVMDIVMRQSAASKGQEVDEENLNNMKAFVESEVEREQTALANSSRGYDDGIIDPRDTRTVLGMALSAAHSNEVHGAEGYGVFRP
jgi:acetyl-CoA carboxylase carboxyltransferase component